MAVWGKGPTDDDPAYQATLALKLMSVSGLSRPLPAGPALTPRNLPLTVTFGQSPRQSTPAPLSWRSAWLATAGRGRYVLAAGSA
jgi:hypothetical protein